MFLPENIDLAHSENYNLSIRLTPDGFSFSIYNPSDPSIFYFQETGLSCKLSFIDNIKKVIFDLGFFSQAFNKTTVTMVTRDYTIVPTPFFDKKQAKEIFDFNFYNRDGAILTDTCSNEEYHIVFQADRDVYSFLYRNLWNPHFRHHCSPLLSLFENYRDKDNKSCCFVNFHDSYETIICYSENGLLSANTFPAVNPHDSTYCIASVWERLGLNQTTDKLYLSGDADSQKTVTDILKKLIRHVGTIELNPVTVLTEEQRRTIPTDMIADLCV